jgi:glyoxylase-like metal-dependent hydrolase (beta-lactamase superfamily II)
MEREEGGLWRLRALGFGARDDDWLWAPCPCYLVRHPTAGAILIDTGLHPSFASDPRGNWGRLARRVMKPRLEPEQDVTSQLRRRGLGPGDIEVVVLTHLHMDHASAISEFPASVFVLSAEEWRAATTARFPLLQAYRPAHYDHAFDYRTIDFEADVFLMTRGERMAIHQIDSYGPFGRCFDLFGDGSVRLAYTPGHSAGHISVILRLPRRDFVVAGDAVFTYRQLEGGPEPPRPYDLHNWQRSLGELQLYRRQYPYALICPGHDPEFHRRLEARYAE